MTLAQLLTATGTVAALLFTAQSLRATQNQIVLTEQGQLTDRFTKAIEQLGSDKPDIRLGGIYSLERLARDSTRDYPVIMEVLTSYIRRAAPAPCPPIPADQIPTIDPTVQATLTVIGRRSTPSDSDRLTLNLDRTCLAGAALYEVVEDGLIRSADLRAAQFRGADLRRVDFHGANLIGANLSRASLVLADLGGAKLQDVTFFGADLTSANLYGADLFGASFSGANLTNANLTGARLDGVVGFPP